VGRSIGRVVFVTLWICVYDTEVDDIGNSWIGGREGYNLMFCRVCVESFDGKVLLIDGKGRDEREMRERCKPDQVVWEGCGFPCFTRPAKGFPDSTLPAKGFPGFTRPAKFQLQLCIVKLIVQ